LPAAIDTDFHHRVMAKIDAGDVAHEAPARPQQPAGSSPSLLASSWFRPFAGMAVAAGVALVTVVLWQPAPNSTPPANEVAIADQQKIEDIADQQGSVTAVTVSNRVQSQGMRWKQENESALMQQKLNTYLVNHTEYSNSMQGLIPQARVAGFDAQQQ
jgi:negative regulator of sigma E activity